MIGQLENNILSDIIMYLAKIERVKKKKLLSFLTKRIKVSILIKIRAIEVKKY